MPPMESIFARAMESPLFMIAIGIVAIALVIAAVKKLLRIAVFAAAVLMLVMGYFVITGQPQPEPIEELERRFEAKLEEATNSAEKRAEEAAAKAKAAAKEAADDVEVTAKKAAEDALKQLR